MLFLFIQRVQLPVDIVVPDQCLPLLREQRTHYTPGREAEQYSAELERTFDQIKSVVKTPPRRVLDVGCGMAGIDVLIGREWSECGLYLLDKDGVSPVINAGYHDKAGDFSHYHSFDAALALLDANGVQNQISCHQQMPDIEFDLVISLLSWGFHYPLSTYSPRCTGPIIVDARKGQPMPRHEVLYESTKYKRIAFSHDDLRLFSLEA